ncbi:hypothetical protein HIM_04384 [Hirsutella minnesotensis 3608]|uniref:Uncharacterized protein n=1 Tax=Hirsutella minnesotensis 3608 TaxID=1043627 RepID=A0A0F8A1L1_9HYPO|nr:hypothetical protein HIM_04384 [Hirsutella minnesotensis 3608]
MKTTVVSALLAGVAVAQPRWIQWNGPWGTEWVNDGHPDKQFYHPAQGRDAELYCPRALPLSSGNDRRPQGETAERCMGTAQYCHKKIYAYVGERFNSFEDCIRSRGMQPEQLATQGGVDRHTWNAEAREKAFQSLRTANDLYRRHIWMRLLAENADHDSLTYRGEENKLIKDALLYRDATKSQALKAADIAKAEAAKAYKPAFAQEIAQHVDEAAAQFEWEFKDFKPDWMPVLYPRVGEVKNLLTLAADLYARFVMIDILDIDTLRDRKDALYREARETLAKAMRHPEGRRYRKEIDDARAEQNKEWQKEMGVGLGKVTSWITEREQSW